MYAIYIPIYTVHIHIHAPEVEVLFISYIYIRRYKSQCGFCLPVCFHFVCIFNKPP